MRLTSFLSYNEVAAIFPGRERKGGTDQKPDAMFERAFSVREFALLHDWPLPQPDRFKWRRCLLVILGAILGTLLLGRVLENLKAADQRPPAARVDASLRCMVDSCLA
jgi:hypothetical protein